MNFRGYAGYVDYLDKMESKIESFDVSQDSKEDSNTFSTTNSSEENENQGSNMFEILEKINNNEIYSFKITNFTKLSKEQIFYHLELYSLLKASLNTPPPEFI